MKVVEKAYEKRGTNGLNDIMSKTTTTILD